MESVISTTDISLIIPIIALFLLSLFPLTFKIFNNNSEINKNYSFILSALGMLLVLVLCFLQKEISPRLAFGNTVVFDGLTLLGNLLVVATMFFTLLQAKNHPGVPSHQYSEHLFLVLSTAIGMFVINLSNDLILAFIGIELMSLPLYVLIGLGGNDKISKEASFKYFVLGSFASAFLLYGVALIYGAAKTTQIDLILSQTEIIQQTTFQMGLMVFFVGLFFKVAVVPFHSWLPDVYQGAPTPITSFMASGVKLVTFFFLLRMVPVSKIFSDEIILKSFEWIAVVTMFVGSLAALQQTYIKRIIAYSSIAHSGYLFMGIVAAMKSGFEQSIYGVVIYLIVYLFMTIGVFAIIGHFEKKQDAQLTLDDFKGLANKRPLLAFCFTVLMLSLAGIPPLGGFFAKFIVFSTAVNAGMYWLVVWGVLSSVVSVYYYLKPVVNMYMYKTEEHLQENKGSSQKYAAYFTTAVILVSGFFIQPLVQKLTEILFRN